MASPESPRFQSFGSQDVESSEADDRHALSPCVTSPLLDDSMEVISGQSGCLHQWQCWLAMAAVVGIILWTLKAHIGVAIMSLAKLAEHAGPWGIVATVFALAAWIMLLMPISLFEVLIGHVFPLRTAPPHRDRWHRRHTPLREAAAALWCPPPPASPMAHPAFGPPGARRVRRGQDPRRARLLRPLAAGQAARREADATPPAAARPRAHRARAPFVTGTALANQSVKGALKHSGRNRNG